MKSKQLRVGVDVGHSIAHPGATSARGKPEHDFNYAMGASLLAVSRLSEGVHIELLEKEDEDLDFQARADRAASLDSDLLISVHHNSVRDERLEEWTWKGRHLRRSRESSGFSVFVSQQNRQYPFSTSYAHAICNRLIVDGFKPDNTPRNHAPYASRSAEDERLALYEYNTLTILNVAPCAAILLECGVIVNDVDEPVLTSSSFRKRFAKSVLNAIRTEYAKLATDLGDK